MDNKPPALALICACCGRPFARLDGETLVIESRHNGENHVNSISVRALIELVAARQN